MDRAQLIAQAKAKFEREQLIAQAKAKYESQQAPAEVKQEMPSWLSSKDRAIAKNFAQSPEKQAEFIQKQYPGAQTRVVDGEVQLKQPSEANWSVVDPQTGMFSSDFLNDAGDIVYDIGSGIGEGVATAAGAIGLGSVTGGAGALPGAMAASSASAAGSEALRQKLGQILGIPQEVSGTDVAIAGGAGLASPLMFGAGKTTSGMAAKLAKKLGVGDAALQAAETSGRGGLERGWDGAKNSFFPWLGEAVSGVDGSTIKAYSNNMDKIDELERDGVTGYLEGVTGKVQKTLGDTKTRLGKQVQQGIESSGKQIDTAGAKNAFQDRIRFLESKGELTNAEQAEVNALKNSYQKYFGLAEPIKPSDSEVLADSQLKDLYQALDVQLSQPQLPSATGISQAVSSSSQAPIGSNSGLMGQATDVMNKEIGDHADILGSEAEQLAKAYREKNEAAVSQILSQIEARRNQVVDANTRRDLAPQIDAGRGFDLQQKLRQAAAWEQNMTPETVSAKGSARNAWGALNEQFDKATDGLSVQDKAAYQRFIGISDDLENKFKDPQATFNTLSNLDAKGKTLLKERLKGLADSGELDLTNEAEVMGAFKNFANPSMIPVSAKGATSTGRVIGLGAGGAALGGYLGNEIGGGPGAGVGGAGLGAAATFLGSPAMLKKIIKANAKATKAAQKMQPSGGFAPYVNPLSTDAIQGLATPWLLDPRQEPSY